MKNAKKFEDDLNTAVITTRFVLIDKSPILNVFHYEDGFWQFSGPEDDLRDDDYKIISLEEIINIDPTVLEVSDLPYRGKAYRETVSHEWKILVAR
jgi:hypothetical protein